MKIYTVSELTLEIKDCFESRWGEVWVEGEISNFKRSQAGHLYFSLKDAESQIRVVLFRGAALGLRFLPEEGMAVVAVGRLSVYKPRGEYQIIAEVLEPRGVGALQVAFEQLKKRLEAEGLFDPGKKKKLPFFPQKVGIVTSLSGAALRDMIQVLTRRYPNIHILIAPVLVQGKEAAGEIVQGIRSLNEEDLDLIIVGRGGGSIEDLWAFNEEVVARAIFESRLPVISAVGHETDFTIADFVADLRAPTPSAAAELAVPVKEDLVESLSLSRRRLGQAVLAHLDEGRMRLRQWVSLLRDPRRRLEELLLRVDALRERQRLAWNHRLQSSRDNLRLLQAQLSSLSPLAILERGFAIASGPDGKPLKRAMDVNPNDSVEIRLSQGKLKTRVLKRVL